MSEPDPAAEVAALRDALASRCEELRHVATEIDRLSGRLLASELTPDQHASVARVRALSEALATIVDGVRGHLGAQAQASDPGPASAAEARPRVLLVEDNTVNGRVAKVLLEKRGYVVDVASDGREAVEAAEKTAYAAVLMDCHMPRLDGYGATQQIRVRAVEGGGAGAARPRVPIIAMTANAIAGERERCLAAGMDDYITKPLTTDALDAVLRRWVPGAPPRVEPGPRRTPSSPAIDLGMLRQLRTGQRPGQPDIVTEVIALFLQDAPTRLATIREAVARGDLAAAARAAHTLKGSAGHLGAKTLSLLASRFDEKVRAGLPFDVAFAIAAIADELDRVRTALSGEGGKSG